MPYLRPNDLPSALALAAEAGTVVVAGCTDAYPSGKLADPSARLLDITGIPKLQGVRLRAGGYRIGAACTWSTLMSTPLPPAFDGLKAAAREVGGRQIQNAGTIAGNLCNASPAADGVPPLLTLDAEVVLHSAQGGRRRLPLAAFLQGPRQTALRPGELLTAIEIPEPPSIARSAFVKLGARRYLVISVAMVAVQICVDAEGAITEAWVAAGACSAVAQRLPDLETALIGQRPEAARVHLDAMPQLAPIDDIRGTASYRREAVVELCQRALRKAAA